MNDLEDVRASDVVLQVPASPASLRVVRMVAATIVADDGFDIDEVDDVRMAVDELCAAVIETSPTSSVRVRFRLEAHRLDVRIDAEHSTPAAAPIDEMRAAVLGAVTDQFSTTVEDGRSVAAFAKRSTLAAPGEAAAPHG